MSALTAVILFFVAGFLGILAGRIYRGQKSLIAGYGGNAENADDARVRRWFGTRLFVLVILTLGLAIVELRGEVSDTIWLGYTAVTVALPVWLHFGMKRFAIESGTE
ncbi:hypothetical protein [Haladaptatus sp. DFWS20]|uniref:hypothetical protein n=1 Tax=Haladaptatus sp. DFWS20 TaxID=3403467 RepID=UPI003EBB8299